MILIFILYFLFASTFTLGKAALTYISPFLFIGIRMMLGGSLLLGFYLYKAKKQILIKKNDYFLFVHIIIFHIFLSYTLEFWALEHVTSAKACLLYNLSPFITAIFSFFLLHERLSRRQICGLIVGFLGFLPILIVQEPGETIIKYTKFLSWHEIALIMSTIASAYGWMIMKQLTHKGYSFIFVNGIGMLGGGLLALILSFFIEGLPSLKTSLTGENIIMLMVYSILLIIIANIICYNLYGYLLSRYSPTFLSFAGFTTPLFAALLGYFFLKETITWHFFVTVICVVFGLYLFHGKKEIVFEEKGL